MIETKLKKIENGEKEKNIEKKLEAFERNVESKIEVLENLIKNMNKVVDEKDNIISSFEKRFEEVNLILEKQEKENKDLKLKIKHIVDKSKNEDVKYPCSHCDFKANSQQGLKVHMKRKHTQYTKEDQPKKCVICSEIFIDLLGKPWKSECIEKHIISHSYKSSSK